MKDSTSAGRALANSVLSEHLSGSSETPGVSVHEKQNKTIRIRKTYNSRLADEAFARSKKEGKKVNESDIIDEALEAYFLKADRTSKNSSGR
ncbi:hypothetical protein ACYZTX_29755 [Pseudomonas sp. MDT1-17]